MDPDGIEIVPPPERLRPFVRRYMYANQRLGKLLVIRPKPTGYTSQIFSGDYPPTT